MTAYALAHDLKGFSSSTLRVRVNRAEGDYVWVTTADLADAGTALVLDAAQVEPEPLETETRLSHAAGLVTFAG